MTNKILVLGKGYLGKEFERHGIESWGKDEFNIKYPEVTISGHKIEELRNYDVIINCIGKSDTRWCEKNENFNEALFINGRIPSILSTFCNKHNIKFVHISTGCLYDDTKTINTEESFVGSHCNYTMTKRIGELGCSPKDLIIRPKLFFSDVKDKNNLLCKLENFTRFSGDKLNSFTCTSTVIGAVKELIGAEQSGIFNVAQSDFATVAKIALWCGVPIKEVVTGEQLSKKEGMYLSNNVMDISKLLKFYKPMDIEPSVKLSYAELNK